MPKETGHSHISQRQLRKKPAMRLEVVSNQTISRMQRLATAGFQQPKLTAEKYLQQAIYFCDKLQKLNMGVLALDDSKILIKFISDFHAALIAAESISDPLFFKTYNREISQVQQYINTNLAPILIPADTQNLSDYRKILEVTDDAYSKSRHNKFSDMVRTKLDINDPVTKEQLRKSIENINAIIQKQNYSNGTTDGVAVKLSVDVNQKKKTERKRRSRW